RHCAAPTRPLCPYSTLFRSGLAVAGDVVAIPAHDLVVARRTFHRRTYALQLGDLRAVRADARAGARHALLAPIEQRPAAGRTAAVRRRPGALELVSAHHACHRALAWILGAFDHHQTPRLIFSARSSACRLGGSPA